MHILLNRGAMLDVATHMSRSISILLRFFDLITATAEKPASHKYDVAKGTRTRRALQPTSGNSDRALTLTRYHEKLTFLLPWGQYDPNFKN